MYRLTQHDESKPVLIDKDTAVKILNQEQIEFNGLLKYMENDDAVYLRCAYVPGTYFKIEQVKEK